MNQATIRKRLGQFNLLFQWIFYGKQFKNNHFFLIILNKSLFIADIDQKRSRVLYRYCSCCVNCNMVLWNLDSNSLILHVSNNVCFIFLYVQCVIQVYITQVRIIHSIKKNTKNSSRNCYLNRTKNVRSRLGKGLLHLLICKES